MISIKIRITSNHIWKRIVDFGILLAKEVLNLEKEKESHPEDTSEGSAQLVFLVLSFDGFIPTQASETINHRKKLVLTKKRTKNKLINTQSFRGVYLKFKS